MSADPPRAGAGSGLTFHGPLSEERAVRLTGELAARTPATVLDIDGEDIRRARDNAAASPT